MDRCGQMMMISFWPRPHCLLIQQVISPISQEMKSMISGTLPSTFVCSWTKKDSLFWILPSLRYCSNEIDTLTRRMASCAHYRPRTLQWRGTNSGQPQARRLAPSNLVPVVPLPGKWSLRSLRGWKAGPWNLETGTLEPYFQLPYLVGRRETDCFDFLFLWDIVQLKIILKFHLIL